MMIQRVWFARALTATAAVVATFVSGSAQADVTWYQGQQYVNGNWVLQNNTAISLTGMIGTAATDDNGEAYQDNSGAYVSSGNYVVTELYSGIPQQSTNALAPGYSAGTQLFAGYQNSMVTSVTSTFKSVGPNFLQNLDLGANPGNADNPQEVVSNNGVWLPNGPMATNPQHDGAGYYGTPTAGNVGVALVPAPGYNAAGPNNGDGGRIQVYGTHGNISSGDAGGAGNNAIPVNADGTFDQSKVVLTSQLGLAINYNGNDAQFYFPFTPDLVGIQETSSDENGPPGFFSRGTGDNAYQYQLHVGGAAALQGVTGTPPLYFDIEFNLNFVAVANLGKGDVNFDGITSLTDLTLVAGHYGQSDLANTHPGMIPGDANGDGIVSLTDLTFIASNWQTTKPPDPPAPPPAGGGGSSLTATSVPEPATWSMLGVGMLGVWLIRRRSKR